MEASTLMFLSEIKKIYRIGYFRSVVEKVQSFLKKQGNLLNQISSHSICSILLLEQEAVTTLLRKSFCSKKSLKIGKNQLLVKISHRNFFHCYEIIQNDLSSKVGMLQELNQTKDQSIMNKYLNKHISNKKLEKLVRHFFNALFDYLIALCFCLRSYSSQQCFYLLRQIVPLLKDKSFLSSLFKTVSSRLKGHHLLILYFNILKCEKHMLQLENNLTNIIFEVTCDLKILSINKSKEFRKKSKMEKKLKRTLLIALLTSVKKDIKLNKFNSAMEALRICGNIFLDLTDLPNWFLTCFEGYQLILEQLNFSNELCQQKILLHMIETTPSLKTIVNQSINQKNSFNICSYFRKNIQNYLPKYPDEDKEFHINADIILNYVKKIKKRQKTTPSFRTQKKNSFLSSSIKQNILRYNQQDREKVGQQISDQFLKRKNKKNLMRSGCIKKNQFSDFESEKKMLKLSKSYLLQKKNKASIVDSLNTSFTYDKQSLNETWQTVQINNSFIKKYQNKTKQIDDISQKSEKIIKSDLIEGGKKLKNKLQIFLQILKKNQEKLGIKRYYEKIIGLENRNLNKSKKDKGLQLIINESLAKMAGHTILISRRRKKEELPRNMNSLTKQKIPFQLQRQKCYERSKLSIQHNLQKLLYEQQRMKQKSSKRVENIGRKGYTRKIESYFTSLM